MMMLAGLTASLAASEEERCVSPLCKPLPTRKNGPFVELSDGSLATVDSAGIRISKDDGGSWSEPIRIHPGVQMGRVGHLGQILRTRDDVLIIVYLDWTTRKWEWNDAKGAPEAPDACRLELWAIRSLDRGKTWVDRQRLLDGYNSDFQGFIQMRSGRIVATVPHLTGDPWHWMACSFVSDDDGKTWERSNWIDLGGHGHHEGADEPTVAELSGGRLLMLIRTSLDRFWEAYSYDGGRYWRVIKPSNIDASSSPGYLLRLRSGRLILAWNRLNPQGEIMSLEMSLKKELIKAPAAEVSMSWYREELSLAFSEDDGKTWTKPIVIAREKGGQLAYPYIFEQRPGELWVFTRYTFDKKGKEAPPLCVQVNEKKLLREVQKAN